MVSFRNAIQDMDVAQVEYLIGENFGKIKNNEIKADKVKQGYYLCQKRLQEADNSLFDIHLIWKLSSSKFIFEI